MNNDSSSNFIALQQQLAEKLGIEVIATDAEQLVKQLGAIINHLILNDMNRLVFILYRVDISEEKVLKILHENSVSDASHLIAEALISRQLQKLQNRSDKRASPDIPEDEKW